MCSLQSILTIMSSVAILCWNPLCGKSVAVHHVHCPSCGSALDLQVHSERLRIVSEEKTAPTSLRVLIAQGRSTSSRSSYYTVKQCWGSDREKQELAKQVYEHAKVTSTLVPRAPGFAKLVEQGEAYFSSPIPLEVPYIVQQYVDGPSFQEIGDSRTPLSEDQAVIALESLLKSLTTLHARGIVARVITPSSIRWDKRTGGGVFAHLDFAEVAQYGSLPGDPSGKVGVSLPREVEEYLAPEIFEGQCGYSADQFSIAASLLYACGVRRGRGESWVKAAERSRLPMLRELLSTMLSEHPKRRFGSMETALSHLREYCMTAQSSESDEDLLNELELDMGLMPKQRVVRPESSQTPIQLHYRENPIREIVEARSQAIDVVGHAESNRRNDAKRAEISRFIILAILGVSLALLFRNLQNLIAPNDESQPSVPTREYSSSSHRVVTQLNGIASFEIPRNFEVEESEESDGGIEVTASYRAGVLKFSSWSIKEDVTSLNEVEASQLLEDIAKGIFLRSRITSMSSLSRTPDGYRFRDFRAQGLQSDYLTRIVLGPSDRALSMSTRADIPSDSGYALERVRFIESLRITPALAR